MTDFPPRPADIAAERQQTDALIARLEIQAAENPRGYHRKLAWLAAVGYGYLLLVLVVSIGMQFALAAIMFLAHTVNVGLIKLAFFIAVFDFILLKSLIVRFEAPEGLELSRNEVPALFADIDEIRQRLASPRPHHVLLTDEFNAAVAQVPRFGIFGVQRNYLIVGLQLMAALSAEEFKSVLAHEFGHLSGNHSRFAAWIYRVRRTWMNVAIHFQGQHDWVFGKFLSWYVPYFSAYSFVLARQHEYVADKCAAELCGARVAADALTRGAIAGSYLEQEWWPKLFSRVAIEAAPPAGVYQSLRTQLATPAPEDAAQRWLTEAVNRASDAEDTHPSFSQRLAALGQEPRYLPRTGESALEHYFGAKLPELTGKLEERWRAGLGEVWSKRHAELAEARAKLEAIEAKEPGEELSKEDKWLRADATEDLGDEDKAFELFTAFAEEFPDDFRGHFAIGRLQVKRGDDAGLKQLERAVELEHRTTLPAAEMARTFLLQRGRTEEAARWLRVAQEYQDKLVCAEAERSALRPSDFFLPPMLPEDEVKRLREYFGAIPEITEVFLVRKQVVHFPDVPFLICGVTVAKKTFSVGDDNPRREAIFAKARQEAGMPDVDVWIQLDSDAGQVFHLPLKAVGGATVYRREEGKG